MVMKIFNGRAAAEDYMSTHSLTFSTPDMTLKKFALWLGEHVTNSKNEQVPRLMMFIEDRQNAKDYSQDIDDSFAPSGAVTDMYSIKSPRSSMDEHSQSLPSIQNSGEKNSYCMECGNQIKSNSKFCKKCGNNLYDA